MAGNHEEMFHQFWDRVLGGIPGGAARPNTRVADNKDVEAVAENLLYKPVAWYGYDGKKNAKDTNLGAFLGWIDTGISNIFNAVINVGTKVDALTVQVQKALEGKGVSVTVPSAVGIDEAALKALVAEAVKEALSNSGDVFVRKEK